ncbi:MAG: DUF4956 domain-containing protein [Fibrobacterales bacterium]
MEFLDIPFLDDDVYKMMFRFAVNMFFLTIVIWKQYYQHSKRRDYLFTYYMISIIVFFLCFTLKKYELDIGMALGLFAIFGIIRYRTDPIDIKEMTYLFVVIGVSVMNSLANKKMSYAEIFLSNTMIVVAISFLENLKMVKVDLHKEVVYEKIENIKPENYDALKADLEERLGVIINRVTVTDVNFMRDTARLMVYFDEAQSVDFKEQG